MKSGPISAVEVLSSWRCHRKGATSLVGSEVLPESDISRQYVLISIVEMYECCVGPLTRLLGSGDVGQHELLKPRLGLTVELNWRGLAEKAGTGLKGYTKVPPTVGRCRAANSVNSTLPVRV
jgi:hypothetical protein